MDVQEGCMLKKIMVFLVATNFVASRLPKHRPTGFKRFERIKNFDIHLRFLGCSYIFCIFGVARMVVDSNIKVLNIAEAK